MLKHFVLFCLNTSFTSSRYTSTLYLRSDLQLGLLIMTNCRQLMRFSYYIHLKFGKKFSTHLGIEQLSSSTCESSILSKTRALIPACPALADYSTQKANSAICRLMWYNIIVQRTNRGSGPCPAVRQTTREVLGLNPVKVQIFAVIDWWSKITS